MATHSSIFCLENPMDRGAWWDTVHGVTKESDKTQRPSNNKMKQNETFSSSVTPVTFKVLSNHVWAVAAILCSTGIEHFHYHRKFFWTLLFQTSFTFISSKNCPPPFSAWMVALEHGCSINISAAVYSGYETPVSLFLQIPQVQPVQKEFSLGFSSEISKVFTAATVVISLAWMAVSVS